MREQSKYQIWSDDDEFAHLPKSHTEEDLKKGAQERFEQMRKKMPKQGPRADGLVVLICALVCIFWLKTFQFYSEGDTDMAIGLIIATVVVLLAIWIISENVSKSKDCARIIERYYKKSLACFDGSPFRARAAYELVPMLYVIGDLALVSVGKNRKKYAKQVAPYGVPKIINDKSEQKFNARMDFYANVVQSGYVWGQWAFSNLPDELRQNPINRCIVACGDLIMDDGCLADYENAPISLYDVTQLLDLHKSMVLLSKIAVQYCKAIDKAL